MKLPRIILKSINSVKCEQTKRFEQNRFNCQIAHLDTKYISKETTSDKRLIAEYFKSEINQALGEPYTTIPYSKFGFRKVEKTAQSYFENYNQRALSSVDEEEREAFSAKEYAYASVDMKAYLY